MNKEINSYWGVNLKGRFVDNNSETLCIILPGVGYYLERSYLDYSKQLAIELTYDVLEIEYGFQVARKDFSIPNEFDIALKETIEIVDSYLDKAYEKIIIIGKSIGTSIQILLNNHLNNKKITNIYLSPIDKTANLGITKNSLVITGLVDPLLSKDSLNKIKEIDGIQLVTIKDAGHSLDIHGDVLRSIDELKKVIKIEKEFICK